MKVLEFLLSFDRDELFAAAQKEESDAAYSRELFDLFFEDLEETGANYDGYTLMIRMITQRWDGKNVPDLYLKCGRFERGSLCLCERAEALSAEVTEECIKAFGGEMKLALSILDDITYYGIFADEHDKELEKEMADDDLAESI